MPSFTYNTPQPIDLTVDNLLGDVEIRATDNPTTSIEVTGPRADEVVITANDKTIEVRTPSFHKLNSLISVVVVRNRRISIVIEAPSRSNLRLRLGAGKTIVTGPFNDVDLHSGVGAVEFSRVEGSITVEGGSGSVNVDAIESPSHLEVGAGSITVGQISAKTHLESGTGKIDLGQVTGPVSLETGAGSLHVGSISADLKAELGVGGAVIDRISSGRFSFDGTAGNVSIGVAKATPTWTDIHTVAGRVHNKLPSVGEPAEGQDHVELHISTVTGSIELTPV